MTATKLPPEFKPVLRYRMTATGPADWTVLDQDLWQRDNAVYIRVSDSGEISYIGKCDNRLCARLMGHRKGISDPDPANPMTKAYREWAVGKTITVYAYQPPPIELCGHRVHVHVGLEAALIDVYDPPFVKRK